MQRSFEIGRIASGKTVLGQRIMDDWLMKHPYKEALVIDSKTNKNYKRYFVPNPQLESPKENGNT